MDDPLRHVSSRRPSTSVLPGFVFLLVPLCTSRIGVTYFFCLDMLRRLLLLFVIGVPCTWRNCLPKEKRNFCVVIMVIIMSTLCFVFDMSFTKF